MRKWIRRIGAAALVVAAVLGCNGACTARPADHHQAAPPPAVPVPPAGQVDVVVGVWRVAVNNGPVEALMVFWPGGILGTTDPGYGLWRARPGGAEGTWETPIAALSITYVVAVDGDQLAGTGLVFNLAVPRSPQPIQITGSRLKIDPTAVGAIVPPHS